MTFDEVKNEYLLRIGQPESSGTSVEKVAEHLRRIRKAYNDICRDTMATWVSPALVELSVVTASTNEHDLDTLLSPTSGIYDTHQVFWANRSSPRLPKWNKQVIDEMNQSLTTSGYLYPSAYATWTERSSNADKWYIAFYPFIATADTTNCFISYFAKPAAPTVATLTTTYPAFADDYHEVIAELAALSYLRDNGDSRYNGGRWRSVQDQIQTMKNRYTPQIMKGEAFGGFLQGGGGHGILRHGERVND